jgi:integrase/recombinase XerD
MAEIKLEYVNTFTDSRGKRRHVFRRKGHKKVTLKGRPGSQEFMDHYHQLLEKTGGAMPSEIGASRTKAGSVNALAIALYKHDVFIKGLAKDTQAPWRRIIEHFRQFKTPSGRVYGENSISTIQKKSIIAFLGGKTANAQKNNLKAIRFLIKFAISQGQLAHDPTEGIEVLKGTKSRGHMTWLEPQVAQYRQRHQLGTVARLALELLLNIAARRHDAHQIGQQHIRIGKLSWRPHKTLRTTGKMLSIRIMPDLQAALDAMPQVTRADGVLTFLVNDYGKPFASAAAFGNKFADWCVAADLKPVLCDDGRVRNYRAHGLRKAALRALAHAGATGVELMAVSGHSSLDQVQEYINEVDQEQAAEAAMTKLALKP